MKRSMFRHAIIRTALPIGGEGEGGGAEGDSPAGSTEEQPQEGSTPDSPGSDEPDDDDGQDLELKEIDKEDAWDSQRALTKIKKLNAEVRTAKDRIARAERNESSAANKLPALEAENLRLRVGIKHGLPDVIVDRLKGDTEEDLLADAEALLKILSPQRPPSNRPTDALRGGGDPTQEPEETDLDKLGSRMFRR